MQVILSDMMLGLPSLSPHHHMNNNAPSGGSSNNNHGKLDGQQQHHLPVLDGLYSQEVGAGQPHAGHAGHAGSLAPGPDSGQGPAGSAGGAAPSLGGAAHQHAKTADSGLGSHHGEQWQARPQLDPTYLLGARWTNS